MKVQNRNFLIAASLSSLLIVSAASAAQRPTGVTKCIALEQGDGKSPVIMAHVNDMGPFAFVLDTAASGTTLDDKRIHELALIPDEATEQAQGMGGAIDVRLYRLSSFDVGPIILHDIIVPEIPAPSFESHDIAGLAGVDVFGQNVAIWRWDRSCVDIAAAGHRLERGWRTTPARWLKPWKIMLPVKIGNVSGWGLLDTGAQKTVLSPAFARAIGLSGAVAEGNNTITGVDGQEMPLAVYDVPNATVGRWRFGPGSVNVAALPLFDRLGATDEPLAVIGMDWLTGRPFAIDYGKQLVWQKTYTHDRP